jgi:predicted metalloprotease
VRVLRALVLVLAGLAAAPSGTPAVVFEPHSAVSEVEAVTADALREYWAGAFRRLGRVYVGPAEVVWFERPTVTACGIASTASYCRIDRTIYVGYDLLEHSLTTVGDFAAATVVAHEWGHEVQDELGLFRWAVAHRYWIGKELQADCYAGMFARHAAAMGLLQEDDLEEGAAMLRSLGDDRRIKRSSPQAHGTPAERVSWFLRGYRTGSLEVCKSVYSVLNRKR